MTQTQDRPLIGILFMLGFCLLAPMADTVAKILGAQTSIFHLVTIRFVIQTVILVPLMLAMGTRFNMSRRIFTLTAIRTVLHIAGIGLMFNALYYLPLADAVAIAFVMPFIMLMLGKYVLHEVVGPHRLVACLVGFVGTMMVVQPNFLNVGLPALLPLGVAVVFALFMLVTRTMAKEVSAIELQAVSGMMACAALIPLTFLLGRGGEMWVAWSNLDTLPLVLALGVLGTMSHLLMTWSLRYAPSATLAPMQYLEIPVATLMGWLVFFDLPDGMAMIGIIITVLAGLYIIWRETRHTPPQSPHPIDPSAD